MKEGEGNYITQNDDYIHQLEHIKTHIENQDYELALMMVKSMIERLKCQ